MAGRVLLAGVAFQGLLGLAGLARHAQLQARLLGEPVARRGRMGADDHHNFLGRAGRVRLRAELARRPGARTVAPAAETWHLAYTAGRHVDPGARVYLNVPDPALYFFTSFFWYPARVEVGSGDAPITDALSLAAHAEVLPRRRFAELEARGFSHVLALDGKGGVELVALRRARAERAP